MGKFSPSGPNDLDTDTEKDESGESDHDSRSVPADQANDVFAKPVADVDRKTDCQQS